MESTGRNLRFIHMGSDGPRVGLLRRFYAEQHSEHLFPRTEDELAVIASDGATFVVEHGEAIVCACYVKWDDEGLRTREFGGICIHPEYSGKKIASYLACLAIGQALTLAEISALKANVHVRNEAPNRLLKSLGFKLTDKNERLPSDVVRPPMKPSEPDGSIIGRVWEFDFSACRHIAGRLRAFPPRVDGCNVMIDLGEYTVDHEERSASGFRAYLNEIAAELDRIASEHAEKGQASPA